MSNLNLKIKNEKELQEEFLNEIRRVEKEVVGHESYADFTEFYDESGVVLLITSADTQKEGAIVFKFTETNNEYSISEGNIEKEISK